MLPLYCQYINATLRLLILFHVFVSHYFTSWSEPHVQLQTKYNLIGVLKLLATTVYSMVTCVCVCVLKILN